MKAKQDQMTSMSCCIMQKAEKGKFGCAAAQNSNLHKALKALPSCSLVK